MKGFLAFILSLGFLASNSQDIHFSQFYLSPLHINPANTGMFDGDVRIGGIQRQQWSAVTIPYESNAFFADLNGFLKIKKLGAGLMVVTDKAGDSHFSTQKLIISGGYQIFASKDSTFKVRLGMQSGVTQQKLDYDALQFEDQLLSGGSSESFNRLKPIYFPDLNSGLVLTYQKNRRNKTDLGITLYNIISPDIKRSSLQTKLDKRFAVYLSSVKRIAMQWNIEPAIYYSRQGKFNELNFGTNIAYLLDARSFINRTLYLGVFNRFRDAAIVSIGMQYNKLRVGASYDINYSDLREASSLRGGFEIGLIYIFNRFNQDFSKFKSCPDYF